MTLGKGSVFEGSASPSADALATRQVDENVRGAPKEPQERGGGLPSPWPGIPWAPGGWQEGAPHPCSQPSAFCPADPFPGGPWGSWGGPGRSRARGRLPCRAAAPSAHRRGPRLAWPPPALPQPHGASGGGGWWADLCAFSETPVQPGRGRRPYTPLSAPGWRRPLLSSECGEATGTEGKWDGVGRGRQAGDPPRCPALAEVPPSHLWRVVGTSFWVGAEWPVPGREQAQLEGRSRQPARATGEMATPGRVLGVRGPQTPVPRPRRAPAPSLSSPS